MCNDALSARTPGVSYTVNFIRISEKLFKNPAVEPTNPTGLIGVKNKDSYHRDPEHHTVPEESRYRRDIFS